MFKKIGIFTLFTILCVNAFAARTYQVNVLIFKYLSPANAATESWQCQHIAPDLKNTTSLTNTKTETPSSIFYHLLPEGYRGLKSEAFRLQNQPGYQVIGRWSWLQPRGSSGRLVHLYGGTRYDTGDVGIWELDGKVKISIGEYITTFTQLYLTEPHSILKNIVSQGNSFCTFKISDSRSIKLNDVNYIDHPLFGVLLQVVAR